MAFTIEDIRTHQIWLTKKSSIRAYKVTRQFFGERVYATSALTSVNQFDNHLAMVGFIQSVSSSGVENFGYKTLHLDGAYNGLAGYENSVLLRDGVTSLTCEVFGNGGAAAQFTFFVLGNGENGGRSGEGKDAAKSPHDWSSSNLQTFLGFDRRTSELVDFHEVYGDNNFIESAKKQLLMNGQSDLALIAAERDFRFDPQRHYTLMDDGQVRISGTKQSSAK